ncbi:EAL domain-containing protein [Lyngbya sp. CCY1209]|uniref:two-component system response regulator n=1 Tax=Lyngbya sp. CCY1209 TaxID=2886103 RepID=UPI002D20EEF7|nr:EAL domain-containing protein [Lyngbya sp. CCY1209]MEB3884207.1 EAL domain-containing protein [Lyngbya sp. CCY1209]
MNKEPLYLILIVDDNPNNIRVVFNFLKKSNFRVLVSTGGEDALRKTKEVTPDLILLDIMMPKIDGFEVCRRLKDNPETREIPVIFMTALAEIENKVEGFALGAVDYVTKPLQQEEVLSRVRLHLKLHDLNRSLQEKNHNLSEEIAARLAVEAELKQLNKKLDIRVQERTQELSQAIKELHIREEKLRHQATHDSLTGLFNRAWLMKFLSEKIADSRLKKEENSILFVDLDRFKNINDRFGHLTGDGLLKVVAFRLRKCLKSRAEIARLGGDEFLIVVPGKWDTNKQSSLIADIFEQFKKPFNVGKYQLFVRVSIGIVPAIDGYLKPTDILRDADIAIYQAKQMGRGCSVVLTPEMRAAAWERIQLESDLRQGIEEEQFCLYYQPIVSLSTRKLTGFEALIRWQHPRLGIVSPGVFIDIAQEIGLISALDCLAFKLACQQIEKWRRELDLKEFPVVNINCSAQRLQQPEIVAQVRAVMGKYEIETSAIKLEVTESDFLKTAHQAIEILRQLHDLGIKLCIDDFGTGHSSLSRLHNFPLDTLKIDRSFVTRLTDNRGGEEIIKTIISLAHRLNMDVVAEGIETREQLDKLIELNCEFGQGYLFSQPLPGREATQFLIEPSLFAH